jgi:hypothetical protein
MPEIGPTLREARMRARIDITEVEEATKIRAKYLRAIENEEWNLLPGSTFVKSFLREYADYLGLDARLLVEEYKLRYDRPSEHELAPLAPNLGRRERRRGGVGSGGGRFRGGSGAGSAIAPRWVITGGLVLLLLVALGLVGSLGGSHGGDSTTPPPRSAPGAGATTHPSTTHAVRTTPTAARLASVQIAPTGTVYVCLVDEAGKVLIHGATFTAGQHVPVYRARALRLTLGNAQATLRVNGHTLTPAPSAAAISYAIGPHGARPLPAAQAPTCT